VRLIIDTDAGVDDAQAIMMALTYPDVSIEAITTLTGNTHVDWVVRNVFTVLDIMGADVPVYRGTDQPILPGRWQAEKLIHGEDGLGNYKNRPPNSRQVRNAPAAVALARLANEFPGELTLVALGPLTNVALACKLDPAFPQKIKQFVFMGGTISAIGNTSNVTAEFNIYCDPEAALMALETFPRSTMLSWETTLKYTFPWKEYDALAALPTRAGRFFRDTSLAGTSFLRQFRPEFGFLLPDPLAMAITLQPDLILNREQRFVTVELNGALTRGQTVVDHLGLTRRDPNVDIITEVELSGVYRLFEHMLA
jgi:purine nucleosidase